MGVFLSDFRPLQLRGVLVFRFYGFTELSKSIILNHHFRRVASCSKTTILRVRQRWVDFCLISPPPPPPPPPYNYDGFSLSQFYGFTELCSKLFFSESSISMSRILVKNDHFAQSPSVRGFLPDSPRYNYEGFSLFQLYGFTGLPRNYFSESPLPMSHILAKPTILRNHQRWSDFCHIFAHCNYEGFSIFQFYGFTELFGN